MAWTHNRQNPDQTKCTDVNCEVTPFSMAKYGDDGAHYHDKHIPDTFEEWYEVEGWEALETMIEKYYEADDFTALAKESAQLGWEARSRVID